MNIIQQLITIARGGARETAEAVVDANALRLLDQQIHECEQSIQQAKRHLTELVAERIRIERERQSLESRLETLNSRATDALKQDDEAGARSLAQDIASGERQRDAEQSALTQLKAEEDKLQALLRQAIQTLKAQRREAALLRANDHSQRATRQVTRRTEHFAAGISDIQATTERIRQRQQTETDHLAAHEEVRTTLDGTVSDEQQFQQDAEAVLERLKRNTQSS